MQHNKSMRLLVVLAVLLAGLAPAANHLKAQEEHPEQAEHKQPFTGTLRVRQKGGTLLYRIYVVRGHVVGGFSAWGGDERPFQDIVGGWFDGERLTILVQSRGHDIHDRWYTHMHQFERDGDQMKIVHSLFDFGKDMSTKIVFQPHVLDEIKELPAEEVAKLAAKTQEQSSALQPEIQRLRGELHRAQGRTQEMTKLVESMHRQRERHEGEISELRKETDALRQQVDGMEELKQENAQLKQLIAEMLLEQRRQRNEPPQQRDGEPATESSWRPLAPLPLELPNPVWGEFIRIPKDIRIDPTRYGKRRPPLMAPQGVTNLALRRPVTSSDPAPLEGRLDMITNGDKEALDGRYVQLGPGAQWVQIELGQPHEIVAVAMWHAYFEPYVYRDVVVQLANDPEFKDGVITVFNNDHDNTLGLGKGLDYEYFESDEGLLVSCMNTAMQGKTARYVRCWSNDQAATRFDDAPTNCYHEVEVWGLPRPGSPVKQVFSSTKHNPLPNGSRP